MKPTTFKEVDTKNRLEIEKYKKITAIMDQRRVYEDYWTPDLDRYRINAMALWGINYGQWPKVVVDALKAENRNIKTFNMLLDKVETFIGSVMGNGFEIRYSPIIGQLDSLVLKLQDMYYSDKQDMFWELSEMEAILDSSCGVGFESMYISDRNHPFGNIAWRRRNPRRVLMNPNWKDQDVFNLHDWFTWGRFTVREIIELFPNISERIEALKEKELTNNINYGIQEGVAFYKDADQKWTDLHNVIEQHWISKETDEWEYDRKNGCFFPDTFKKFHTDEDIAEKMKYVRKMGLSQDDIQLRFRTKTTKYIRAICPTLDGELFLLDNPDIIQNGTANLFPIGIKMDGQYQGMVDRLYDVNRAINEYELTMDTIHKRGAKDSVILDEMIAGANGEKKEEIERKYSEIGGIIWAANGTIQDAGGANAMLKFPAVGVTADIIRRREMLDNTMDRLSKVSSAEEARSQYAGEPNKMFENKVALGKVGKWFYSKIYENHQKSKAVCYAKQAKYTYAGVEREFSSKGGKDSVRINQIVSNETTGKKEVLDDITLLPDLKVKAELSKDGIDIRSQFRQDCSDILNVVSKDPSNRPITLEILGAILDTLTLPDEEKESFGKTIELMLVHARLNVLAGIKQVMAVLNPQPQQPSMGGQMIQNIQNKLGTSQEENVPQQKSGRIPTEAEAIGGTPQQRQPIIPRR